MREPTTRRAVLKATGALGTIAALAVPVAVLPKAEAAETADTALLAMGRELDVLATEEQAASAIEDRLYLIAEQHRAAPSPALLAYSHHGEPLFRPDGNGFVLNTGPYAHLLDRNRHCPDAPLVADLRVWQEGGRAACEASGAAAAFRELERLANAGAALCRRIVGTPATTPAGIAVKVRALAYCHRGEPGDGTEWIDEVISGSNFATDERMVFSVFRDVLALLGVGGTHV